MNEVLERYLRSIDSSSAATRYFKNTELELCREEFASADEVASVDDTSCVAYTAAAVRYVVVLAVDVDPMTTESTGSDSSSVVAAVAVVVVVVEAVSSTSGTVTGSEKSTRISTSWLYPKGPARRHKTTMHAHFLCGAYSFVSRRC